MTTDRAAYIDGLRQLADFLASNPDAPLPTSYLNAPVHTNEAVTIFGALDDVQLEPTADDEGNLSISIKCGPIEYRVYGYANWPEHLAAFEERKARTWAEHNGHELVAKADA